MIWRLSAGMLAALLASCHLVTGQPAGWPVEGQGYNKPVSGLPPYMKNFQEFVPKEYGRGAQIHTKKKCGAKHPAQTSKQISNLKGDILVLKAGALAVSPIRTIKVYFHNRYYIDPKTKKQRGYVSAKTLLKQIEVLNAGFAGKLRATKTGLEDDGTKGPADTRIVFTTAGRLDWPTYDYKSFRMPSGSKQWNDLRKKARKGGCNALNVYIHELSDPEDAANDILGEATFPDECAANRWLDGLFMDHRTVPGVVFSGTSMLGRTLVHETGHWLGLLHIFQDKSKVCEANADEVSDTPDGFETSDCPVKVPDNCRGKAFLGKDPIRNFMDYPDDACMWKFTPGQAARMYASAVKFRAK